MLQHIDLLSCSTNTLLLIINANAKLSSDRVKQSLVVLVQIVQTVHVYILTLSPPAVS